MESFDLNEVHNALKTGPELFGKGIKLLLDRFAQEFDSSVHSHSLYHFCNVSTVHSPEPLSITKAVLKVSKSSVNE